ncbi:hypothetical protein ACI78V_11025 [Geodermatophilus sp. SYSU D00742]
MDREELVTGSHGGAVLQPSSALQDDWRSRFDRRMWAAPQAERRQRVPVRFSPQMSGPSSEAAVSYKRASVVGVEDGPQCRGERSEVAVVDTAVLQLAGQLAEERRPVPSRGCDRYADLDPALHHVRS